jgi:hypothetical protein
MTSGTDTMAICTIDVKVKIAWWVRPLIKAAALVHRLTGWPCAVDWLAHFIVRRGVRCRLA